MAAEKSRSEKLWPKHVNPWRSLIAITERRYHFPAVDMKGINSIFLGLRDMSSISTGETLYRMTGKVNLMGFSERLMHWQRVDLYLDQLAEVLAMLPMSEYAICGPDYITPDEDFLLPCMNHLNED
jgi:hypothetical protein